MHCCEKEKTGEAAKGALKGEEPASVSALSGWAGAGNYSMAFVVISILIFGMLLYNQLLISSMNAQLVALTTTGTVVNAAGSAAVSSGSAAADSSSSLSSQQVWDSIRPQGVPAAYGSELQVSYDDVEGAIARLSPFDDLGNAPIQLEGGALERYITVTTAISCEYCCGASAIATRAGDPACGCAHSAAMRGLAKYLLKNHPDMSDADILNELGKWKVLFFPQDSVKKALTLEANGLPINYLSLSSNQYRDLKMPTGTGGSSGNALPNQVGGC